MAEEIKQLQALLHEFDGDGTMLLEMEEGGEEQEQEQEQEEVSQQTQQEKHSSKESKAIDSGVGQNRTVKLKYGSLIKTIEASSRQANAASTAKSSSNAAQTKSNENQNCCRNCLRLMFTIFYLIYSKAWVIINTSLIFIVIFICYSIK